MLSSASLESMPAFNARHAFGQRPDSMAPDGYLYYSVGVLMPVAPMSLPRVVLLPKRARPFYGRHPWVYPGAIACTEGEPADGAVVELVSHGGHFVARGIFNSRSKLRVRLYAWNENEVLDGDFFTARLQRAIELRSEILGYDGPAQACRLVYSESDGLSGLVVDRYDRWLTVQFTALGLAERRELFADALMKLIQPEGIYLRTERGIGQLEGVELEDGLLRGYVPADPIVIEEDDIKFRVHLAHGQKTGFYLDQRENRIALAPWMRGRKVLDAFCYTGGFGLHAARAGAASVRGIDTSESAIMLARENALLNGLTNVSFRCADVFESLNELKSARERFGAIILDPPKFARSRRAIDDALRGYRRLESLALGLLEPNGLLVMCCCSGVIGEEMLEDLLAEVAVDAGRPLQILARRGQAPDHPISVTCPETAYLKCLVCRVT
jgi:23S rRNA (cytosine1962-C5)-methyltransferase